MTAWQWEVRRCFGTDDARKKLEEKGWRSGFVETVDEAAVANLLAESDKQCLLFLRRDPGTGECWFEIREQHGPSVVVVRGAQNIPTPEEATLLLADYGIRPERTPALDDRPLYELPLAPAAG